jgi:hypothetical protein
MSLRPDRRIIGLRPMHEHNLPGVIHGSIVVVRNITEIIINNFSQDISI